MKKEWLLLAGTVLVTVALSLGLIRWFAPGLLGIPIDLQAVRVSKEVVPFYENALPMEELRKAHFSNLQDPYTGTRHRPMVPEVSLVEGGLMWGPSDVLGFHNRSVPIVADVVTIGDSLTFGTNATLDFNWPNLMALHLEALNPVVYNMAVGGWGAVQYLSMFQKAPAFWPRVVVVAFYTGNDPLESVRLAYDFEPWADLRPGHARPDPGPYTWPPEDKDLWPVRFADGVQTQFAPTARLLSNDRAYPATGEGYAIMAEAARRMAALARDEGIALVFTILPTKELALSEKVRRAGLKPPATYTTLVRDEKKNIAELAGVLKGLEGAEYVDMVAPLQRAALGNTPLYLQTADGHPVATGYDVIARTLAPVVAPHLPPRPANGIARVLKRDSKQVAIALILDDGVHVFESPEAAAANGWKLDDPSVRLLRARDVAAFPFRGVIRVVDPARFGPRPAPP